MARTERSGRSRVKRRAGRVAPAAGRGSDKAVARAAGVDKRRVDVRRRQGGRDGSKSGDRSRVLDVLGKKRAFRRYLTMMVLTVVYGVATVVLVVTLAPDPVLRYALPVAITQGGLMISILNVIYFVTGR